MTPKMTHQNDSHRGAVPVKSFEKEIWVALQMKPSIFFLDFEIFSRVEELGVEISLFLTDRAFVYGKSKAGFTQKFYICLSLRFRSLINQEISRPSSSTRLEISKSEEKTNSRSFLFCPKYEPNSAELFLDNRICCSFQNPYGWTLRNFFRTCSKIGLI